MVSIDSITVTYTDLHTRTLVIVNVHFTMNPACSSVIPDGGSDLIGSKANASAFDDDHVTLRKRKEMDGDLEIKQVISDFKSEILYIFYTILRRHKVRNCSI